MSDSGVRYARNDPVHLAYRVLGDGDIPLVLVGPMSILFAATFPDQVRLRGKSTPRVLLPIPTFALLQQHRAAGAAIRER